MTEHDAMVALARTWREKAAASQEEANRIRRTVMIATGAEERCNVRAEIWNECAAALDALSTGDAGGVESNG